MPDGLVRTEAAQMLARNKKFDEAERLVEQAIELAKNWPSRNAAFLTQP